MELDAAQSRSLEGLAPPVADAVLMDWPAARAEQPLLVADRSNLSDVFGDEIDQTVGEMDDTF